MTDDYFFILESGSRSRMQMKEFCFGVRCKLEIFPLGSGSGSRLQSHWTYCMILVLVCKHACVFLAFKLMHSAHGENAVAKAGREKKKSRNSQTYHSGYSFLQRKNK